MDTLIQMGEKSVCAKYELQKMSTADKNNALEVIAQALLDTKDSILTANEEDIRAAVKGGMHPGMADRLRLSSDRINSMSEGLLQVKELPDPNGELLDSYTISNGLHIQKKRVPIGVIGMFYESRPNVTADAFGLCFKSGNAVILKGGSDAIKSNIAITNCIRKALTGLQINEDVVQLIEDTDRATATAFMKLNQYVDLLIPRGGAGLIQAVLENSTIPVIETGTGNCHIFVDESADLDKAIPIIINSKTQRIGVCNSCESLLVHEKIREALLPALDKELKAHHVEVHGDIPTREIMTDCIPATEEDYGKEYLDYILSVKTVSSVEEAISHINKYNTKHSEAIITENKENADRFLNEVDAACVYVNAATRFTDGFVFGLGAEIGISTQKIHARGPMGLKELTSYKYTIYGDGQIRE